MATYTTATGATGFLVWAGIDRAPQTRQAGGSVTGDPFAAIRHLDGQVVHTEHHEVVEDEHGDLPPVELVTVESALLVLPVVEEEDDWC